MHRLQVTTATGTAGTVEAETEAGDVAEGAPELQARLKLRWSCEMGRCVDATPLVVWAGLPVPDLSEGSAAYDHTGGEQALALGSKPPEVFIGSHSRHFKAVDVASGTIRWEKLVGDPNAPQISDDAAIEATAAVSGNQRRSCRHQARTLCQLLDGDEEGHDRRPPAGARTPPAPRVHETGSSGVWCRALSHVQ